METMRQFWKNLRRQISARIPRRDLFLAPADCFFTQRFDLPEGLSKSEIEDFAALSLEANAPFPVEQMAWGYLHHPDSPWILVFGTPRNRLKKRGLDNPESCHHVFPGFITLFGVTSDKPTVRFVCQNGSVSALLMAPGNPVPEKVISRPVAGELLTDDAMIQSWQRLVEQLGGKAEGRELPGHLWVGEQHHVYSDDRCAFSHRAIGSKLPENPRLDNTLPCHAKELWQADVRDGGFARKEFQARQFGQRLWRSLNAAAGVAVILLLLQFGVWFLDLWNQARDRQVRGLQPAALRVEHKLTLANRLTQSVEEDIHPFRMLSAVNENRPGTVYFNKVGARSFRTLEIEGESTAGVTPVNDYADRLLRSAAITDVINNSSTRVGRTSFEFQVTFDNLILAQREDEEVPEPESGEDESGEGDDDAPEVAMREAET